MSGDMPILASAVIVPETDPSTLPQPPSPTTHPLKRRQSSLSTTDSKRPRLSNGHTQAASPPATADTPTDAPPTDRSRKPNQDEERKRSRRLFGALLGTLSQGGADKAGRKRREVESKQQERLARQAEEREGERRRRLEGLVERRRGDQRVWDEQSIRIRHSNVLAMANFLQTKTEPKLYYRPWELRPEEEDRIKQQVEDAERAVDEELDRTGRSQQGEAEGDKTTAETATHDTGDQPNGERKPTAETEEPATRSGEQSVGDKDEDILDAPAPAPQSEVEIPTNEDTAATNLEATPTTNGVQNSGADGGVEGQDENNDENMEAEEDVIY